MPLAHFLPGASIRVVVQGERLSRHALRTLQRFGVTMIGEVRRVENDEAIESGGGFHLATAHVTVPKLQMTSVLIAPFFRWLALVSLAWTPALAFSQSLQCSDKIISRGSTSSEVASLCGKPDQVEHKTIYNDVSAAASGVIAGTTTEVHVEMWIYNFGPDRLMQRIWIEDGVVVRIESMGHGF